ncbi:3'-5' exonuclease [Comamonas thiooxydans]|uniref:3'-5' exonuclease n=1 Tax=Comamonas thiooxydans TaxID=363952 RepID=UPI0007C59D5C|nr:3'-5' exonuclease [Comamonas thiooxydans]
MSNTPIIIAGLDTETTGLNQSEGHRLIEVYVGLYDIANGCQKVNELNMRIHPQRGIDPSAQEVHGIALEDLAGAPYWEQAAPQLHGFLVTSGACAFVAHNGEGFDMPFMMGEFVRVGLPLIQAPLVDTMLQGRWATPDGAMPNLGALAFACGVPYDKNLAHAADYDVDVMMKCFAVGYPRGFFQIPTVPYMFEPMKAKAPAKSAKRSK